MILKPTFKHILENYNKLFVVPTLRMFYDKKNAYIDIIFSFIYIYHFLQLKKYEAQIISAAFDCSRPRNIYIAVPACRYNSHLLSNRSVTDILLNGGTTCGGD
jgi:hypothetical protein